MTDQRKLDYLAVFWVLGMSILIGYNTMSVVRLHRAQQELQQELQSFTKLEPTETTDGPGTD